jgi:hypothetical protein
MAAPQIPQYMAGKSPFKFNRNFDLNSAGEANTYNNIFAEATYQFGSDVVFIERTVNTPEFIFGEYLGSVLAAGTPMRLFQEELTAWGGGGDMYKKFGLTVTDEVTFYCPTLTFMTAKPDPDNEGQFLPFFPKQSDLILHVNSKKLFEIQHIETEAAPGFFVFGNKNSYVMKCKMYTYDHSGIDASADSLPPEIKALDNVTTVGNKTFDLLSNEENNFNKPIATEITKNKILDNSETDPLRM